MNAGGEPITIISSILGMVGAIASFATTENPLAALGMLGPLTGMIGSAVAPAASMAGSLAPSIGNLSTPALNSAGGAFSAASAGMGAGSNAMSLVPSLGTSISPELAAMGAMTSMAPGVGSSIGSSVASALPSAGQQLASATGNPTPQSGNAPTLQAPSPTSAPNASVATTGQTPPNTLGQAGMQAAPKQSFFERMFTSKPNFSNIDPNMDPAMKQVMMIQALNTANQQGAMKRGLLSSGLQGLAAVGGEALKDDEYKPNYGYRSKKRMLSPRESYQRGNASLNSAPTHMDLLSRIGYRK